MLASSAAHQISNCRSNDSDIDRVKVIQHIFVEPVFIHSFIHQRIRWRNGPQRDSYSLSVISGLHIATMMAGYSILGSYPMEVMHSFKLIIT